MYIVDEKIAAIAESQTAAEVIAPRSRQVIARGGLRPAVVAIG